MGTAEQMEQILEAVYNFANETVDRVPLTDWYWTDSPH